MRPLVLTLALGCIAYLIALPWIAILCHPAGPRRDQAISRGLNYLTPVAIAVALLGAAVELGWL